MSDLHYHAPPVCEDPTQHDTCDAYGPRLSCRIYQTYPEEMCECEHESVIVAATNDAASQENENMA